MTHQNTAYVANRPKYELRNSSKSYWIFSTLHNKSACYVLTNLTTLKTPVKKVWKDAWHKKLFSVFLKCHRQQTGCFAIPPSTCVPGYYATQCSLRTHNSERRLVWSRESSDLVLWPSEGLVPVGIWWRVRTLVQSAATYKLYESQRTRPDQWLPTDHPHGLSINSYCRWPCLSLEPYRSNERWKLTHRTRAEPSRRLM